MVSWPLAQFTMFGLLRFAVCLCGIVANNNNEPNFCLHILNANIRSLSPPIPLSRSPSLRLSSTFGHFEKWNGFRHRPGENDAVKATIASVRCLLVKIDDAIYPISLASHTDHIDARILLFSTTNKMINVYGGGVRGVGMQTHCAEQSARKAIHTYTQSHTC